MMKHTKYIILSLILLMPTFVGAVKSKTFLNILALGNIIANKLDVTTDLTVGGNFTVVGGVTISGDLNMGGHNITNVGKITATTVKTTNVESTSGNVVIWPLALPADGEFLGATGASGQLQWTIPAGAGNVSSLSTFGATSHIITSSGASRNVQVTPVTLDGSGNMSGIVTLGATTVNATGITMTGDIAMGTHNISNAGTISAAAGTALAPSITFQGDPNTGIFNSAPGADQLGISCGGTMVFNAASTVLAATVNLNMSTHDITNVGTIGATTVNATTVNALLAGGMADEGYMVYNNKVKDCVGSARVYLPLDSTSMSFNIVSGSGVPTINWDSGSNTDGRIILMTNKTGQTIIFEGFIVGDIGNNRTVVWFKVPGSSGTGWKKIIDLPI